MRIKKTSETTPTMASVVNATNSSTTDAYSCDYINEALEDVYSTTEIKTNKVWINGKPIYRKVVEKTSGFSTGESIINHGISNLAQLVSITGMAYRDGGDYEPVPATLPPSSSIGQYQISIYDVNYQRFRIYIGSTGATTPTKFVHLVVVFEYTKTTD